MRKVSSRPGWDLTKRKEFTDAGWRSTLNHHLRENLNFRDVSPWVDVPRLPQRQTAWDSPSVKG